MYDIVIIGAGMAGLTAAIYAQRAGRSVLVLEGKMCGGQIMDSLKVDNWPGEPGISGANLMEKVQKHAEDLGVEIRYEEVLEVVKSNEFATSEDAAEEIRKIWLIETDETKYMAKAVIVAMGTEPRKLSEKQVNDAGKRPISYCATCDGALYKNKPVVVIGSGNTAKHEIKYLQNIAAKVYHIHHDEPIPKEAEAVFVAIGRVPTTELLKGLVDLDENGYVVAGDDCRTSMPGLFVAGDCRKKTVRQLVTAAADGAASVRAATDYLN